MHAQEHAGPRTERRATDVRGLHVVALLTIALLTLLLAACTRSHVRPPDDAETSALAILTHAAERHDGVHSARIRATLEYYGDEGRVRVRQVVLASRPAFLRLETLSPFDTSLNVLVSDGAQLQFLDLQGEQMYEGPATAENMARLIPIGMTPADLVRFLLGDAPVDTVVGSPDDWPVDWDSTLGAYRIQAPTADGGRIDLLVNHGTWRVVGLDGFDTAGERVLRVRAGNHRTATADGVSLEYPGRIEFQVDGVDASLDVESYQVNPTLSPALFGISAPAGVPVRPL